jgi:hypothetical protein
LELAERELPEIDRAIVNKILCTENGGRSIFHLGFQDNIRQVRQRGSLRASTVCILVATKGIKSFME